MYIDALMFAAADGFPIRAFGFAAAKVRADSVREGGLWTQSADVAFP